MINHKLNKVYPYFLFLCLSLFIIGCVGKETLDLNPNDLEFVEEPILQESETQLSVVDYKQIPEVMNNLYVKL